MSNYQLSFMRSTAMLAIGLMLYTSASAGILGISIRNANMPPPPPEIKNPKWSLNMFGGKVSKKALETAISPPLSNAPGSPQPWQAGFPVYNGMANLATGNLTLTHNITGWASIGPSVSMVLIYNNQESVSTNMGARWRHSLMTSVSGTSTSATVIYPDGSRIVFSKSAGVYTAPVGIYEVLTDIGGGGWTLTFKDGSRRIYNSSGQLTQIKDQYDNVVSLTYTSGNLTSVSDASGRTLSLAYTSGKLTSITDYESKVWTLTYDGSGQLTTVTDPSLGGTSYTTQFGYDSNGYVTSRTNRLGYTWQYTYSGSIFSYETDPAGHYSGATNPGAVTNDQNGFSSAAASQSSDPDIGLLADVFASIAEVSPTPIVPDTVDTTYPVGTVTRVYVEDASGCASEYGLDSSGTVTAYRNGNGYQTNFAYDTLHNRTKLIEPGGATTTSVFDTKGNITSITDATSRVSTNTYNSSNNLTSSTDPAGKTTTFTYSGYKLTGVTDATNRTTTYSVASTGLINSMTDNAGKTTSYLYDSYGDNTRITDPLGNQTNYTFSNGRMATRVDGISQTTSYSYDGWGRMTGIDYPTSTDIAYTYDAEGRLLSAVDGTGTRTYTYDSMGRKTAQTDPRGNTTATYDYAGKLATQTDVNGRSISYTYDGTGRVIEVSDSSTWIQYTYDNRNRVSQATYSNGNKTLNTYDAASRISTLTHKNSSNTVLASYTSSYDTSGKISSVVEGPTSATISYTYDDAGRLLTDNRTGANPYVTTYTYNTRGLPATIFRSENGVTSHDGTYTYDDASQVVSISDTVSTSGYGGTYTWGNDGNLLQYPGNGYTRKLEYDEEGRVTKVKKVLPNSTESTLFEYGYGYDGGQRWRKDTVGSTMDWYPCGVACSAGELVSLRSTNNGSTWSTLKSGLGGMSNLLDSSSMVMVGMGRNFTVTSTSSGSVTSTTTLDAMVNVRSGSTNPLFSGGQTWLGDENLIFAQQLKQKKPGGGGGPKPIKRNCQLEYDNCMKRVDALLAGCIGGVGAIGTIGGGVCLAVCVTSGVWTGGTSCIACLIGLGIFVIGTIIGCLWGIWTGYRNCQDEYYKCLKNPIIKSTKSSTAN